MVHYLEALTDSLDNQTRIKVVEFISQLSLLSHSGVTRHFVYRFSMLCILTLSPRLNGANENLYLICLRYQYYTCCLHRAHLFNSQPFYLVHLLVNN